MSNEQKSPEELEAERQAIAERVIQTANELEQLLKEAKVIDPNATFDPEADPTFKLYDAYEVRLDAEAAILEEVCDIVLPEIKLVAKPIRVSTADTEATASVAELETLCGSLPARHRQSEWLDVPAFHLDGSLNFLGAFTDAQDGDTGVLTSKAYYLLVDGRLVEVHLIGTWQVVANELQRTRQTIVATRVVTPKEVVGSVSLTDLFMKLRHSLHLSMEALEGQHVPDLAERRERFDAIVRQYTQLVKDHTERLRRVGDSPG